MKVSHRLLLLAMVAAAGPLAAGDTGSPAAATSGQLWTTDYQAAVARAKAENRLLFLQFTGSDWCPWCIKLDKEILDTPEFRRFASKKLVPVCIDFPQRKSLDPALQSQNAALAAQFGVEGYPTIWIVSPDGSRLGQLGYMEGGPKTFIRAIRELEEDASTTIPLTQ